MSFIGTIRGKTSDTTAQVPRVDATTHTIQIIDYAHHEIHAGSHFFYTDSVELGSGATQVYLITTPDTAKWAHLTFSATGSAITTVDLYEGADRVGDAAQTVFNNNRNSATTATVVVHKGITGGTTDGTKIYTIKSGASAGASRSPSVAQRENEIILDQNTKYLLRITSGTAANLTNLQLEWYEHTDRTA